jgi:hypothetical protein
MLNNGDRLFGEVNKVEANFLILESKVANSTQNFFKEEVCQQ